jgi:hypothetical protein
MGDVEIPSLFDRFIAADNRGDVEAVVATSVAEHTDRF